MSLIILPAIGTSLGFAWDEIQFATSALGRVKFPQGGANVGADDIHGKVEVTCKIGRDLGEHKTSGRNGHRIVDKGMKPAEIKIKLTVYDQTGMDQVASLMAAIEPRKRIRDRSPVGVFYPSIRQLGIEQILFSSVTGLVPTGTNGHFSMDLDCVEFTPPAKRQNQPSHTVTAIQTPPAVFEPNQGTNSNPRANAFNRSPSTEVRP